MGIIINEKLEEYRKDLKKKLKKSRYIHSLGVSSTAACLAMRYNYDIEKAQIAGLLHDVAKCLSDKDLISNCKKAGMLLSSQEEKNPELLHSKLGSIIAKDEYHIKDKDILNAIYYHTTGKIDMTILEKIIFVADYIEPSRRTLKDMEIIRQKAFENIDEAIVIICRNTINYLESHNRSIDQTTIDTYNFYINQI